MHDMRTTTGQSLSIRFDPRTGQLFFKEYDWFAEPLRSTGVPPKALLVDVPMPPQLLARRSRRKPRRAA